MYLFKGVCLPYYRHPSSAACFLAPSGGRFPPSAGQRYAAAQIDVIVWAGLSRRPPQNAKSLRPRQLKRRSKKDLRPRGRFWAQGPQVVPSHLGNPIAENLDPRHGDSDIAPVLRQSFICFLTKILKKKPKARPILTFKVDECLEHKKKMKLWRSMGAMSQSPCLGSKFVAIGLPR